MSDDVMRPMTNDVELLTQVRDAVLGVSGVAAMHAGALGEVATYLPGDRINGVRRVGDKVEIHIAIEFGRQLLDIADAVRERAESIVECPVKVVVEDVVEADTDK